jgi:prepilin-type N-terminal cleavage/methylation domain-containing protein
MDMKNKHNRKKQGFTLIEMLVVVLIIGILAAIALPQYRLATEKARAAEAFIILRSLRTASDIYKLETGAYPTADDWDKLSIEMPGGKKVQIDGRDGDTWIADNGMWSYYIVKDAILAQRSWPGGSAYNLYYMFSSGKYYCQAYLVRSDLYRKICQSFCGDNPFEKKYGDREECEIK